MVRYPDAPCKSAHGAFWAAVGPRLLLADAARLRLMRCVFKALRKNFFVLPGISFKTRAKERIPVHPGPKLYACVSPCARQIRMRSHSPRRGCGQRTPGQVPATASWPASTRCRIPAHRLQSANLTASSASAHLTVETRARTHVHAPRTYARMLTSFVSALCPP